jgi:hypothetical protein
LIVFLAEAVGGRRRVTPIAGTSVLLAAFILLSGLVLLPASLAYTRYETWKYFANASVAEPDLTAQLLSGLTVLTTVATVFSMVSVWLLFTFANRVRRVGGMGGWGIGLGVIVLAYFAGSGLPFVRDPIIRIPLILSLPLLLLGALLWATNHLARIDSARSVNNDGLPGNRVTM